MARFAVALTAALALSAGAAHAAIELTFKAPGAQSVYINGFEPGSTTVDPKLHGLFNLSLVDVSANGYQWNFSYNLANTSTEKSRLATIGWNVAEDFSGVTGVSGLFDKYATGGEMSSLGKLDVCLKSNSGASCSGGGNGGLTEGAEDKGLFSLTFASQQISYVTSEEPVYNKKGKQTGTKTVTTAVVTTIAAPTSLTLSDFAARYQSLAGGGSTVGIAALAPVPIAVIAPPPIAVVELPPIALVEPPPAKLALENIAPLTPMLTREDITAVPEPSAWVMMITGFGFTGAMLRRRRVSLVR